MNRASAVSYHLTARVLVVICFVSLYFVYSLNILCNSLSVFGWDISGRIILEERSVCEKWSMVLCFYTSIWLETEITHQTSRIPYGPVWALGACTWCAPGRAKL